MTVIAVNAAPVLAAIEAAPLTYPVSSPPAAITSTLTVSDADSPNLAGATVQITANCVPADDVLTFVNTASISGVYSAATCLMTLSGSDTPANYQAALRNVRYSNTNAATSAAARTVSFRANDGAAANNLSNIVTRTINVQVDTPPVLAGIEAAPVNYVENGSAVPITATLTVADSDSPNLVGATVQLTANCASGEDVLSFTNQSDISGIYTAASCLLTLTGSATLAKLPDGAAERAVQQQQRESVHARAHRELPGRRRCGGQQLEQCGHARDQHHGGQ